MSHVRYGGNGVSIAIPAKRLHACQPESRQPRTQYVTSVEMQAERARNQTRDFIYCLDAVIALQLLEGHADIDHTAMIVGTSVRTLQRTIRDAGSSYRRLLGAARLKRSFALLRETNLSIMDISLSLGYSDQANFTRAFVRWYGQSPSAVRRSWISGQF